jgi:hypothetical protein
MEVLRAELAELTDKQDWEDDDIARSEEIPDEFAQLEAERTKAEAWETKAEAVRSAVLASPHRESGDGATALARKGPEIMRTVDPYDNYEVVRAELAPKADMISRAKKAVEIAPGHMDDAGREHVMRLLDKPSPQTSGIARHLLMTGSDEYHREFEEYWQSMGTYPGQLMRAALSLTGANGGRVAVLCG